MSRAATWYSSKVSATRSEPLHHKVLDDSGDLNFAQCMKYKVARLRIFGEISIRFRSILTIDRNPIGFAAVLITC